ncbi:MAG: PocR ligand-binding domain-containing protein, partial [Bacteroidota bacterium]
MIPKDLNQNLSEVSRNELKRLKEQFTIHDIIDIDRMSSLMKSFQEMSGYGWALLDENYKILAQSGWQKICHEFHRKNPETPRNCIESDRFIEKHLNTESFVEYKCKNGLWDVAYPVILRGRHIATFYFGQFAYEDQDWKKDFEIQAQKFGFDSREYRKAMDEVPVYKKEQVEKITTFFKNLVDTFTLLADTNLTNLIHGLEQQIQIQHKYYQSQNLLNNIIEKMPLGLQIFDKNGTSQHINLKQIELLGLKESGLGIGEFNVLTDPYSKSNGAAELYQEVYDTKEIRYREYEYNFNIDENKWNTRNDRVYFKETIFPILDNNNDLQNVICILEDITEFKRNERTLIENEEQFRSIFENSIAGIAFTTAQGELILCNDAFERLIGYSFEQIKGRSLAAYTHEDDIPAEKSLFKDVYEKNTNQIRYEKRYITRDKAIVWVDLSVSVIRDVENKPEYYIAVAIDITDKKNYQAELKALNSTKDKFFSIISHDLRNPFGSILNVSEILIDTIEANELETAKKLSRAIHKSADKGFILLNNLLDWSRSQLGKIKFNPVEFGLKTLISDILDNLESKQIEKDITVENDVSSDFMVYGDKNMMHTVLHNLISNALKFTNHSGKISIIA